MKREIRQFRPEDAENVAQMWNESDPAWPGGFTGGVPFTAERVLRDQSRTRFLATFIAFADGKAVGYCSVLRFREDPRAAYVGLLSAHPAYHGQGFGRDLLKAALALAIDQGYDRLDLHTWAGNLKAVPLYKKTGFFWVPETSVHMENYLPTIFKLGCARDFFKRSGGASDADWYTCFRRDLGVRPDEWTDGGMKVFPYEFERDGRRLRVLVDPQAHAVTAVETDSFAVACRFAGERAPAGMPATLRWEVRNRRPEAGPIRAALLARGEEGLQLDFRQTLQLADSQTLEAVATPERDVRERRPSDPAHRVRTTAVLGDEVVELATGLRVCQPASLSAPDRCVYLAPGVPKKVSLLLRSNLEAAARVAVRLAGPPELRLEPASVELELPARGHAGVTTTATASAEGAFALAGHLTLEVDGATTQPRPQSVPVHSVGLGGAVASLDEQRAYLTTAQLRVVVNRRAAVVSVYDAATGASLGESGSSLGPPFGPSELDSLDFDVEIERAGGTVVAVLSAHPSTYPDLVYQRRVELAPGPVVRLGHRAIDGSDAPRTLQVLVRTWGGPDPCRIAVPLSEGLVVDETVSFPDWRDPELLKPASFQESWIAAEGGGRVAGWIWERASTVETGRWGGASLTLDFGEIGPSRAADAPALWLYAGPGGWEAVRRFWRGVLAADAPDVAPKPRRALEARLTPPVLVGEQARLELSSLRSRALGGHASLEFPGGPRLEPGEFQVAGWQRGKPQSQQVRVKWPADAEPGAWAGRLRARLDVWDVEFPLTLIRGGDARRAVQVREGRREGRRVVVVDNGWMSFAVAPDFAGALIELRDARASHLCSAFPRERPFQDLNPWFGGVVPQAIPAETWGWSQPMAAREYRWEPTQREGLLGQRWSGVALSAEPAHKGLRGLAFRVEYLTLGQSNLLAVVTRLDRRGAPLQAVHGILAHLAPGGSVEGAVAHFERGGLWSHHCGGGVYTTSEGWVAVENPTTGDVVAAVAGAPAARLAVEHDPEAAMLVATSQPPGAGVPATDELVTYLVLARSLAEARLYRALGGGG